MFLLVSQHRKGPYSCSSTAVELSALGAGGRAGEVELGRTAVMRGQASNNLTVACVDLCI